MKRSTLAVCLAGFAALSLLGGCVAETSLPSGRVAVAAYGPFYYAGYPVYYDAWGYPIYYVGGVVHYVPRSYPRYGLLLSPYRAAPYPRPYAYGWHARRG
jgi:hypothetical protein